MVSTWSELAAAFANGEAQITLAARASISAPDGQRLALRTGASSALDLNGGSIQIGLDQELQMYQAAVLVEQSSSLTIDDSFGGGLLSVQGGRFGAGIGLDAAISGAFAGDAGSITINGGTIIARGGSGAAGIGASDRSAGGIITINGGTVTGVGGERGAGIGGGGGSVTEPRAGSGGTITINGGTVTATAGRAASGIGGGGSGITTRGGGAGTIVINGGTITATGGSGSGGPGIGSGEDRTEGSITINDGVVTAIGGSASAGIGGGFAAYVPNVSIHGGTVTATGGSDAPGIGTGERNTTEVGPMVSITGGTVRANGGRNAAGIGGGWLGSGGTIAITGGDVEARGGDSGPGIGSGRETAKTATVTIDAAHVVAVGGRGGAGIGSGLYGWPISVTIGAGSVVTARGGDGGAGIGGGRAAAIPRGTGAEVTVTGGRIDAIGGGEAAGIGAGGNGTGSMVPGTLAVAAKPLEGTDTTGGDGASGRSPTISGNSGEHWYKAVTGSASMVLTVGHRVEFDTGDGGSVVPPEIATPGGTVAAPPSAPTRPSHAFDGWRSGSSTGPAFDFSAAVTGDTTVHAAWEPFRPVTVQPTVGGGGRATPASAPPGEMVTLTPEPAPGYAFDGWSPVSPNTLLITPLGQFLMPSEPVTVMPRFSPVDYTLTYDLSGGTLSTPNPAGYTVESGALTLQNPTRNGYEFAGWTGTGIGIPQLTVTIPSGSVGNRHFEAAWTPIPYAITYDLAGGSAVPANPSSYLIESPSLHLTAPTRAGYDFAGWTGTDLATPTLSVTIPRGSTGDRAYAATWTPIPYAISYDLAGGSVSSANATGYTVETPDISLHAPTRVGYDFAGWSGTDLATPTLSVTIPRGSLGDRSYTATWTPTSYAIAYDLAGGVMSASPAAYTTESPDFGLTTPTRAGYDFSGWTGTDLAAPTLSVTIPRGSLGDRSYTATWTPVTYAISYDLAGGTMSSANPVDYTIESADFDLTPPTRAGYTFTGWTGTGVTVPTVSVTVPRGSTGDRTYTASWALIPTQDAQYAEPTEGSVVEASPSATQVADPTPAPSAEPVADSPPIPTPVDEQEGLDWGLITLIALGILGAGIVVSVALVSAQFARGRS